MAEPEPEPDPNHMWEQYLNSDPTRLLTNGFTFGGLQVRLRFFDIYTPNEFENSFSILININLN